MSNLAALLIVSDVLCIQVYYAIYIGLLVCITRSVSASADRVAAVKLHEQ